jgi:hypothetical protein
MRRMLLERSGACAQRIGNDRLSPDAADIELFSRSRIDAAGKGMQYLGRRLRIHDETSQMSTPASVLTADPMREPNKARVCAEWAT